jgi:hypothetical protein
MAYLPERQDYPLTKLKILPFRQLFYGFHFPQVKTCGYENNAFQAFNLTQGDKQ